MILFYIYITFPFKLILRQVSTWSFIPTPFNVSITVPHKVYTILQLANPNTLINLIYLTSDLSLSNTKGYCLFINKQFSID